MCPSSCVIKTVTVDAPDSSYVYVYTFTYVSLSYSFFPLKQTRSFQSLYMCIRRISHFSATSEASPIIQYFFEREFLLFNIVWIKLVILHNSYVFPVTPCSCHILPNMSAFQTEVTHLIEFPTRLSILVLRSLFLLEY